MTLKSQIKKLSLESGFDLVGMTDLKKDSEGFRRFQEWLQKGFQGEMGYLERGEEKRGDPELVLEGAKSVVVLGWEYGGGSGTEDGRRERSQEKNKSPFISRYAWREDYHLVLGQKVKLLEEKLHQTFPTARFRSYVDTGPVMEKYWASLSGIGWLGKHTNVIHPERGSYFFLTCLLTDLKLEPDAPVNDHCGRCTACIDVCPTRAIIAPYVLDARLCISYLTIELKGPIPRELRPHMGTHIFGCDDCQEVCPWNKEARLPEEFLRNIKVDELLEFLSFDSQDFKNRFERSPILRAKRRGFLRNVCVALGNIRDLSALPALTGALEDEEPLIRGHAAWALGQFEHTRSREALENRQTVEKDAWVKEEIDVALTK